MANRAALIGDRPPAFPSKATLAAELDISETTVDDWVKRGILPKPIRLGGSVRWSWAQVTSALNPEVNPSGEDQFMSRLGNV